MVFTGLNRYIHIKIMDHSFKGKVCLLDDINKMINLTVHKQVVQWTCIVQ